MLDIVGLNETSLGRSLPSNKLKNTSVGVSEANLDSRSSSHMLSATSGPASKLIISTVTSALSAISVSQGGNGSSLSFTI